MARGKDTKVKQQLASGRHTRVDRERIREVSAELDRRGVKDPKARGEAIRESGAVQSFEKGEAFVPTEKERHQNSDRLERGGRKFFSSPGIPGIHFPVGDPDGPPPGSSDD